MTKKKTAAKQTAALRRRARAKPQDKTIDLPNLSSEQVQDLIHELQAHQIELEMQNDELRLAQEQLVASRDRYSDLYDFAPVGYATIGEDGRLLDANLTLAGLLGIERRDVVGSDFSVLIAHDDQDLYYMYRRKLLESKQRETLQFRMLRGDTTLLWVEMESILIESADESKIQSIIIDITQRRSADEALTFQATHDPLTGLINRAEFERRLARVVDTAQRSRGEHAMCYLDLDQFKVINDTCGHMAGDELLRQIGKTLLVSARKRDTLARLGGDEFGLLMEHCSLAQARRVANKVRRAIENIRFVWEGRIFHVGVSIGLVPISEGSENVSNVLSMADSACYAAKDEGRNRVHVYSMDDTHLALRQGEMQWVARINQAMEDHRLQLWSQPVVALGADSGTGEMFEILLRLLDERGQIILAAEFLPAAERYGLSTKIDRWVVATAFGWLSSNPRIQKRLQLCFINLSGASLADEEFLSFLCVQLEKSRIPAAKICFEITETAAISDLSRAMDFMAALHARGCLFALDDFGSGLSSFAYLKALPVDYLKIDGAFVKDILSDDVDLALVRSINDVGKVMGKLTIAEFVEDEAIFAKLRELGVDFAQGNYIAQPSPLEGRK